MSFNPGTSPFRIRFAVANEAAAPTGATTFQLYARKNGGSWLPVTTSSTMGVKSTDAGSSADETAITVSQLTPPP